MRRSFASSATTFPKLVLLSLSGYSNQGFILFSSVAVRLAKKEPIAEESFESNWHGDQAYNAVSWCLITADSISEIGW